MNLIPETMELLAEMKIPYCFNSSTLKALLIQGKRFESDTEIDVIIPIKYREKILNYPLEKYFISSTSVIGMGSVGMVLHDGGWPQNGQIGKGIAFASVIEKDGYEIDNIDGDMFHIHPAGTIFPFGEIEVDGVKYSVPNKPEEYLRHIYGDEWNIDNPKWAWVNSVNIMHANTLDELIQKYKEKHG